MYQESQDNIAGGRDRRPSIEHSRPTVEKYEGRYYFFCSDVFDLSNEGRKLSADDLEELPIRAIYTGEDFEFQTDVREAFILLMRIFRIGNLMQDRENYSWLLGMLPCTTGHCI